MELATRRNFRKTTIAVLAGHPDKLDPGQCERLNLDSLHRFMLRWLDHAQVEGIGGIIDHFYTEFGAKPRNGEFTPQAQHIHPRRSPTPTSWRNEMDNNQLQPQPNAQQLSMRMSRM